MTFDQWDTLLTPFPFVDLPVVKLRPCLVLSQRSFNDAQAMVVLAMITTAAAGRWPDDHAIQDLAAAGLRDASVVRWKVFTLPTSLMLRRIGSLSSKDRTDVRKAARHVIW